MNPDTMTLTELRDWHAREGGCVFVPHRIFSDCPDLGKWIRNGRALEQHPFPATLDGAASAMPKGWEWGRGYAYPASGMARIRWVAFRWEPTYLELEILASDDEITDRYRLAMKAKLAEKETKRGT